MKIWAISDTHCKHNLLEIPYDVDMVIHSGDESSSRSKEINSNEVMDFVEWFDLLPIQHKIWIPGNHSTSIGQGLLNIPQILSDRDSSIHYLLNSDVEIEGIKIWGSPYTPTFGQGWAFNMNRFKLHRVWDLMPDDTDIVVTHGPPMFTLDVAYGWSNSSFERVGCVNLAKQLEERVKPKYNIFGHIHEDGGKMLIKDGITYINASVLDLQYRHKNNGIIFDYGK